MRITYDPEADALYIELRYARAVDNVDLEDGVSADLDAEGHVLGFEVLGARERFHGDPLDTISIERLVGNSVARAPARRTARPSDARLARRRDPRVG